MSDSIEPAQVIIRHPDFADDIYVYGTSLRTIYIDLGSSFDVTKLGVEDREQVEEWAESLRHEVADLPAEHPARLKVEEVISETMEEVR